MANMAQSGILPEWLMCFQDGKHGKAFGILTWRGAESLWCYKSVPSDQTINDMLAE